MTRSPDPRVTYTGLQNTAGKAGVFGVMSAFLN